MNWRSVFLATKMAVALVLLVVTLSACSGSVSPGSAPAPSSGPGVGGAVVRSDSIISGELKAIRKQTTGYPWEVDVLVQSSESVENLPNPTRDKVGQVITAKTDENLSSFRVDQQITARVKYVGDVPKPGISLYIYDIKAK